MPAILKNLWLILKLSVEEFSKDRASNMAAAQAYFTVFALPPLLIILAMLLGIFLDNATIQAQIHHQAQLLGGINAAETVQNIFKNAQSLDYKNWLAGSVSLGILLYGSTNFFAELQTSLNTIWGVEIKPEAGLRSLVISRFLGFGLIMGLGGLVLLSMFIDLVLVLVQNFLAEKLGLVGWVLLFKWLSFGLSYALMTAGFAILFWFLPDVKSKFRDVIVGSLFTSALFSLSRFGLGFFLSYINVGSAYGAAGTLMIFLFFIFISMQLFFFGAEFTEIYARSRGNHMFPSKRARWLPGRPRKSESLPETGNI
jgi:membrane protein